MLTRLAVVALIAFTGLADRAAAQVVAGAPPGPTLEVADTTEDGLVRMEVKVGVADPGESFGRLVDMESGDPPLWPDQAIVAEAEQSVADGVEPASSAEPPHAVRVRATAVAVATRAVRRAMRTGVLPFDRRTNEVSLTSARRPPRRPR